MVKPSKEERIKFNVDYTGDNVFSSNARLQQSKWRDKKGYPQGKLGNFLDTDFATKTKSNFLTKNIQVLVEKEVLNSKKTRGLISEPRIWNNLLSSQPLCFNLFGELHYDLELATKYFQKLFPNVLDKVTSVMFEYSPGRGDLKYLGDHSAFDVFIKYSKGNKNGFIAIEVKYAECLKEETLIKATKNFKEHYATLTNRSGLFEPGSIDFLKRPPLSQIWRDHLLSVATKQDFDKGFFVFLFPSNNINCQKGVDAYKEKLASKNEIENGFCPRYLEDFINALSTLTDATWAEEMKDRYVSI